MRWSYIIAFCIIQLSQLTGGVYLHARDYPGEKVSPRVWGAENEMKHPADHSSEGTEDERKKSGGPNFKYFNNTMVGIITGKSSADDPPLASLSFETVNGVAFFRYFGAGIGIAYDQYNTTAVLPLFLSLRGDLLKGRMTPFYYVDAGYGPAWDSRQNDDNWAIQDVRGGWMFHLGVGFKIYSGHRINVMTAIGYKHQFAEIQSTEWIGTRITDLTFRRMSIRLGIGF